MRIHNARRPNTMKVDTCFLLFPLFSQGTKQNKENGEKTKNETPPLAKINIYRTKKVCKKINEIRKKNCLVYTVSTLIWYFWSMPSKVPIFSYFSSCLLLLMVKGRRSAISIKSMLTQYDSSQWQREKKIEKSLLFAWS